MDEVVEIVPRWDNLYGGGTVVLFGKIDHCTMIQQFAVNIGEENDDWGRCASKLTFLHHCKTVGGFEYSSLGVEGNIVEEHFKKFLVELPFVDVVHDVVGNVRHVCLFIRPLTRQCIIDIGNRSDFGVTMHFFPFDSARIAGSVDMFVVLSRNRRENAYLWQITHFEDAACAISGVFFHDVELARRQTAVLIENIRMYVDFSKIVQESAKCDEGQFFFRQVTEHSRHC